MLSAKKEEYSRLIKKLAAQQGFSFCGIAKAVFLEEEAPRLENWLKQGKHGLMTYMANHFDKRLNPSLLVPGARSVISVLYNYYPTERLPEGADDYKISKYAYAHDYHIVIKEKLFALFDEIRKNIGAVEGRVFVDSAPMMDKVWAKKAGLGWVGKHSNLLNRSMGSFFFIAEIVCDLELEPDGPIEDYCGTCTSCIDACPTEAITPYEVDGSKCISYFTIELKEEIPAEYGGKFNNWIFGCDICQDVCPWNRFAKAHNEPRFVLSQDLKNLKNPDWEALSEQAFELLFKHSPLKRSKYSGLKRNINFVKKA